MRIFNKSNLWQDRMLAVLGMGKISEMGIMKEGYETLPSQHNKVWEYYNRMPEEQQLHRKKILTRLSPLHAGDIISRMKKDFCQVTSSFCEIEHPCLFLPRRYAAQRRIF